MSTEWFKRRQKLMRRMGHDAIAIIPAAPIRLRNGNVQYSYRQDSDFYYLTGFEEPEAVAVLLPERAEGEFVLFVRANDPQKERWDGPRAGTVGAVNQFGADEAWTLEDMDERLGRLLASRARVFYTMGIHPDFDQRVLGWVNQLRRTASVGSPPPQEFIALDHPLHEMRLFKSAAEIKAMRASAQLAVAAHQRAMQAVVPGMMEYQLAAEFYHTFTAHHATMAYEPIVGGGANACILHYRDNRDVLRDGDLVLIDAGCELGYYASDITRTFPVNGRFSEPQAQLYDVVLNAQKAAIEAALPGAAWDAPHQAAVRVITQGLMDLGFLKAGSLEALIATEAYKPWFMHKTGHWLGMDVHDVGEYKKAQQWRALEPSMVLTVEPGLYVPPDDQTAPAPFRGMGIRIEDDVLITPQGHEVLTKAAPKERADIESWMQRAARAARGRVA